MLEETGHEVRSRDSAIAGHEETMESLRNELEMKGDEIGTLMEKISNIEVKLRLSNQKLRVTEQVLTEKEEAFRREEAKHLEEQALLEKSLTVTHETYRGMMKEIAEKVNTTLDVFQSMSEKLTEKQGKYEKTVMEASKLLWAARNWVIERNHEKEKMKKEMERKEEEIKKLGEKVREDEKEKERKEEEIKKLGEKVRENEKEKERMKETLVGLGEEKREAIRQLCVWIDHHRGRCEYLEEVLSKTVVGRGQRQSQRA